MLTYLKSRMNRATYWAMLGLIAALAAAGSALFHQPPKVTEVVLLIICIPRLHDIGRSGWWAGGVVLLEFAFAFGLIFVMPSLEVASIAMGAVVLAILALLIWLGAIKGDPEANRFGPPPKPGFSFKSRSETA